MKFKTIVFVESGGNFDLDLEPMCGPRWAKAFPLTGGFESS